ncbi:hypothetical protein Dimus_019570 [Dionaea muscipula]
MICRKRCIRVPDNLDDLENPIVGHRSWGISTSRADKVHPEGGSSSCFFRPKVVFPEDFDELKKPPLILDPQGSLVGRWNKIFLVVSLFSLFIDPLFLFSPHASATQLCTEAGDASLDLLLTVFRSMTDVLYAMNTCIRFHTSYVAPSSRVLGRGELVIDPWDIAFRYLGGDFLVDFMAALPIPQVIIWGVIPSVEDSSTKISLRFCIILPYLLRVFLLFPLSSTISRATGPIPKTAWTGAAYNMMLYYLISHVTAASWYLLALQREVTCWRSSCNQETPICEYSFFDCDSVNQSKRSAWAANTNVTSACNPNNNFFNFGIYQLALQVGAPSSTLLRKYFFSFWWGLQTVCSIGNNLWTSANVVENMFTNLIAVIGLILFASLLGNVQRYLDSTLLRLEEWIAKRADTEQWMHRRKLPSNLRQWARKYDQYKWVATRGVDEEALLKDLPWNLRREISRHLCFNLLRQLPLCDEMDNNIVDAVCERVKPVLCIKGAFLFRECDPVNRMIFIIRGTLESYTSTSTVDGQAAAAAGGGSGWLISSSLGPGSFCGEELLTWALALDPNPTTFPLSTRTVKACSDVEAYCLMPEDLKYLAKHFKQLHSKKLMHNFRLHSYQWQTWAACYIQKAWRRYTRRKALAARDQIHQLVPRDGDGDGDGDLSCHSFDFDQA